LIVLLVSVTPLLSISGIAGYQFHTAYRSKVRAHLEEIVEKHSQNIDRFLSEKLANIRALTRLYGLEKLKETSVLYQLLFVLQAEHQGVFTDLGLVNEEGVQVSYAGPFALEGARYKDAEWFKETMHRRYYISDVFYGLRRHPHFIVAVKREWEGKQWILRATIDFVAFNYLVENIQIGKTGFAFIVSREGNFQTRPREDLEMDRDILLDLCKKISGREPSPFNPRGEGGAAHATIPDKQKIDPPAIYVMSTLKGGDWILVFHQEVPDAFLDLYHARNLSIGVLIVGGLSILLMAVLLSKRIIKRIAQADSEKEMMNEQVIEAGKLASLGELAAGIAHEINNPVAIMVEEAGWIKDLLEDEGGAGSADIGEIERALGQIRAQGKRCKEITHKLLSFARRTDPMVKEVQINDIIEEVVDFCEQRAKFSKVTIKTDLNPYLPKIAASPSEIQQVLMNLVNNAIDAMDATGGQITLKSQRQNGYILVGVSDSGEGIPQANLQRIFDPFFTTKPVGKGTGLGLSICYGIIQKMDGQISVNSAVGVGTTFHIRLPVAGGKKEASD